MSHSKQFQLKNNYIKFETEGLCNVRIKIFSLNIIKTKKTKDLNLTIVIMCSVGTNQEFYFKEEENLRIIISYI